MESDIWPDGTTIRREADSGLNSREGWDDIHFGDGGTLGIKPVGV